MLDFYFDWVDDFNELFDSFNHHMGSFNNTMKGFDECKHECENEACCNKTDRKSWKYEEKTCKVDGDVKFHSEKEWKNGKLVKEDVFDAKKALTGDKKEHKLGIAKASSVLDNENPCKKKNCKSTTKKYGDVSKCGKTVEKTMQEGRSSAKQVEDKVRIDQERFEELVQKEKDLRMLESLNKELKSVLAKTMQEKDDLAKELKNIKERLLGLAR